MICSTLCNLAGGGLNIGNEKKAPGLITGFAKDTGETISAVSKSVAEVLNPAKIMMENAIQAVRHPIETLFLKNGDGFYRKSLFFIPSALTQIVTKAIDTPVELAELVLEKGINNNVSRVIDTVKGLTTGLISNIITSNGQTKYSIPKYTGAIIEGAGDLIGSGLKSPLWVAQKAIGWLRGMTKTTADWGSKKLGNQRISEKDYVNAHAVS